MTAKKQNLGELTEDTFNLLMRVNRFLVGDRFKRQNDDDPLQIVYSIGENYVKVFLAPEEQHPKEIRTKIYSLGMTPPGRDCYKEGTETYNELLAQWRQM